jgi:nicotinamidase/pyrazinamidase
VVDVQNDFAGPRGALSVQGGGEVVAAANREIERVTEAGGLVVYTQNWHPASTPHLAKDGGIWPVHCVAGTWGAELVPGLDVAGRVIRKGGGVESSYSGFTVRDPRTGHEQATGLSELLRDHGIERVVIVGLATDYCVKEAALDALDEGFPTTVVEDAVRAVDRAPGDGARALHEMVRAGADVRVDVIRSTCWPPPDGRTSVGAVKNADRDEVRAHP